MPLAVSAALLQQLGVMQIMVLAYPECEVGKTLGQTRKRLVPRSCLGDERESGGRPSKISAGELDALGLAGLILERSRCWRCESSALGLAEGLLMGSTLGAPAGGRAGEHGVYGAERGATMGCVEGN
jgi:hypothetical protein